MMDREIKTVHCNGITWLGWHWYDKEMYGLKDKVVIRYSLSDLSQIYVFHKNEFLCTAKPIEQVNPMASESEGPKDMEAVKEVIHLKKKVKSTTRKLSDLLETKQASQIDWSRSRTPEISEAIQKIESYHQNFSLDRGWPVYRVFSSFFRGVIQLNKKSDYNVQSEDSRRR